MVMVGPMGAASPKSGEREPEGFRARVQARGVREGLGLGVLKGPKPLRLALAGFQALFAQLVPTQAPRSPRLLRQLIISD